MKLEAQRIAIAEACGCLRYVRPYDGKVFLCLAAPNGHWTTTTERPIDKINTDVPDYLNDLNAMHEAEKVLTWDQKQKYVARIPCPTITETAMATPSQRAEAFLRTIGKWEDAP